MSALTTENVWMGLGFLGQGVFAGRFLVQWVASERAGRSVVPTTFWYMSLFGGLLLLAYAIWRKDPVFIIGQSTGTFVYFRNLHLIRKATHKTATEAEHRGE